jgi:type III restriction enzyme
MSNIWEVWKSLLQEAETADEISHFDYLQALNGLLQDIETEIKRILQNMKAQNFQPVSEGFQDKEIRVNKK